MHIVELYKIWRKSRIRIPKLDRYSIGLKIESDILELLTFSLIIKKRVGKSRLLILNKNDILIERLKLFVRIIWEEKALPDKKYALLSEKLVEIGRILGARIKKETAPQNEAIS